MMRDWTEAFKERLSEDELALPAGELEVLEGMIRSRNRRRILSWASATLAVAASVAVAIVLTSRGIEPTNSPAIVPAPEEFLAEVEEPSPSLPVIVIPSEKPHTETVDIKDDPHTELEPETELKQEQEKDSPSSPQESKDKRPDSVQKPGFVQDDFHDYPESRRQSFFKRFSVAFSAGSLSKSYEYMDGAAGHSLLGYSIHIESEVLQYDPSNAIITYDNQNHKSRILTYEISLRYQLSDVIALSSGLCYYGTTSDVLVNIKDSRNWIQYSIGQNANYLGVPIHLDWYPLKMNHRFSMYVGAGGEARKCVYARIGEDRLKDNGIYFSAIALAGLKYEPIRRVGLFIEPQYSYSFIPENPAVRSALTESPSSFTVKLGLSFDL